MANGYRCGRLHECNDLFFQELMSDGKEWNGKSAAQEQSKKSRELILVGNAEGHVLKGWKMLTLNP